MIAIVTILVKKREGSLSAVLLDLSRKGYQPQSQEITGAESSLERIRLLLKCSDKNAEQVEKDFQSLEYDNRIEKIELESTPRARRRTRRDANPRALKAAVLSSINKVWSHTEMPT